MSDPNRRGDGSPETNRHEAGGPKPSRHGNGGPESADHTNSDRDPLDEPDQIANEERRRNTAFVSGLVAVLGAWVALSVLVYDVSQAAFWNNVAAGGVVFLAGGYNYYRQYNGVPLSVAVAALVAILGVWLVVAAAAFALTTGAFWSTLVSGVLIAGLAGYNAYESREARAVAADPGTRAP